ncbi:MAG: SUMF1/EgtB/PvdO family nonheme iron enzyme [Chloroflexi bacterium]|nr:SUMF1/EgtB/PvdO family nonheme iron enzyme [Chloroflexota bacterium]
MSSKKPRIDVMVSSTTNDLGEHRKRLSSIISSLQMVPRMMDNDSAMSKDGLSYSLDLVNEAEIYVLLLGFRYGYKPDDPRNPDGLSMTHLEYRRAKERSARGQACVLVFLLDDRFRPELVYDELTAFRKEVLEDKIVFFDSIDDLEKKVLLALSADECVQQFKEAGGDESDFEPRVGEVLAGRYTFVRKLGQGGNGEVWQATDPLPCGGTFDVAIKILKREVSDNPKRIKRFEHEIGVARRLNNPHIIRTTHWDHIGAQFYAVMDYVKGETLRDFMQGRVFSDKETVHYLQQIAEALHFAHQQGIVHRDVKPENILMREGNLYLGDFGLAVSPEEDMSLTDSGEWVGTKKYMAPEQWYNQPVSPQTDVYALAIIAYEMLTGEFPYDASSHARLLQQHMDDLLPAHPTLPDEILSILHRATAKKADERYPTASDFITDLVHWRADPENVATKINKYLDDLRIRRKLVVFEKLFVDLEGDIRSVFQPKSREAPEDVYDDPFLTEFEDVIDQFLVELDADLHQPTRSDPTDIENMRLLRQPETSEPSYVEDILETLTHSQRVVLVGEPGSGKTFTLERLAMHYINRYADLQRVPVYVPLNAFKGDVSFEAYIRQQMRELAPYYTQLLKDERLVLICDALNEMPRVSTTEDQRELLPDVRDTLAEVPLFVVSCRIRDYDNDLDSLKLERLEVRDLELPAIREFVRRYKQLLKYDDEELWQRMGGSQELMKFWQVVQAESEPQRFWKQDTKFSYSTGDWSGRRAWQLMWEGAKLIPLARNPYLARVICTLHQKEQMPDNRAELYMAFVSDLYEREKEHAEKRGQPFPDFDELKNFLTGLARQMQTATTTVLKIGDVSDDGLMQAGLDASILVLNGDDIRFAHQLLQEYFSAETLAVQMYAGEDPTSVIGETWWDLSTWRETALMLAEFTKDVEGVARWLGQASPELGTQTLQRIRDDATLETISENTRTVLIQSAQTKTGEKNPVGRAAAYRVLGLFDADDRPGLGLNVDGLPDFGWVRIPNEKKKWIYQGVEHDPLPAFYLTRYPVTYRQFQAFLDADDGYDNPDIDWLAGMAADEADKVRENQYFKYWNHPRESVNWYQAMAFCRWLSWKLSGEGAAIPALADVQNWGVRLPTEFEWEKAARGLTGLKFPYGNTFDPTVSNTPETGINQTSAPGIFPAGKSPYGIMDMSGNVWEWCLTDYENPQVVISDENFSTYVRRMLRGSSWDDTGTDIFRASDRPGFYPFSRSHDIGFRCARSY